MVHQLWRKMKKPIAALCLAAVCFLSTPATASANVPLMTVPQMQLVVQTSLNVIMYEQLATAAVATGAANAAELQAAHAQHSAQLNELAAMLGLSGKTPMEMIAIMHQYMAMLTGPLTRAKGVAYGPSGRETYYNLDMSKIVFRLQALGIPGQYWVREDGVKMYGDYVMCAANFALHPLGSTVETSLGTGIVCDTGTFIYTDPFQVDIAVAW